MTETEWWNHLRADRARLLRVLRKLLVDLGAGNDATDSQRAAWKAVKELETGERLLQPEDGQEFAPIMVACDRRKPESLGDFFARHLIEFQEQDGQLESLSASNRAFVRAFSSFCQVLLNKGVMNAKDLANAAGSREVALSRLARD